MNTTPPKAPHAGCDKDPLDQTTFYVDAAQMKAFEALTDPLTAAESANPGLDHLMMVTRPWAEPKS